ncbi:hypothetical protein [Cellvibrio mixtus]|uniref:hypothetical protein n=1 Tax=Cellvibrio mixtus TaxID=39650 RepID=UPI000586F644|nr:hypothetical protein [Cellvibrio mixtus]
MNTLFESPEVVHNIPEDTARLTVLDENITGIVAQIVLALKNDQVVLVRGVTQKNADDMMFNVAQNFGLDHKLEVEAGFASVKGHRENVGKYFMTVNKRDDYHFIPAHCEGSSRMRMQLASFYAVENTTDGGSSILLNINDASPEWSIQRELVKKCKLGNKKLSQYETMKLKMMHGIELPADLLTDADVIISNDVSPVDGVSLFNVLEQLRKVHSVILDRDCYAYWDTVASYDFDSGTGYFDLLRNCDLLKIPDGVNDFTALDNAYARRVWKSGTHYPSLFKSKLTQQLMAGDLVFMNNLSWAHSTSNWNPGSGRRKVLAAFA